MKLPTLRSNPKVAEHSHEGESRDYNISSFLTSQSTTWFITNWVWNLENAFEHKRDHQSSWLQWKTNDSLSTKHDVTMKPVHDINHTSNVPPENKATSKAEYTNTQQDLPINGYNLVHLTRHARLFCWRSLFCRKATSSRSLLSDFSFHNSSSINYSR